MSQILQELLLNKVILATCTAWCISQILKAGIHTYKFGPSWDLIYAAGRFPSSHAATVTALTVSLFGTEGLSSLFFVAFVFSIIVIRDSVGVRLEVQKHAKLLKEKDKDLSIFVGHTPVDVVVGCVIGAITAICFFL